MSQTLGDAAADEVLRMPAQQSIERINAFVKMEQMYAATAQHAFEEAETQLRQKAEQQFQLESERLLEEHQSDAERLHQERQRDAERFQKERQQLEQKAQYRI